ncbi:MAG: glycosyltransferase family 4 protein [Hyphomicrobiaceae bacterium]
MKSSKFRVLHCLRAPVGGLFRHVCDLASAQAALGHDVGVLADSAANDRLTDQRLDALSKHLSLGLHRIAMSRDLGLRDLTATFATIRLARRIGTDVIHGHGAKGGAYARLAAGRLKASGSKLAAFYTPHGGSLHYAPSSLKGRIFMGLERRLASATDGIIFESAYSAKVYASHVGAMNVASRVIPNGLLPHEFGSHIPATGATDIVFIGELRRLKGVDLLLQAIAGYDRQPPITATIVGDGPDAREFQALVASLGLTDRVTFPGAMPAAKAFPLGRILVMPSRAESFPYIVLEAAAAAIPLIATEVGGIPEIVAGTDTRLVPVEDVAALRAAIVDALTDRDSAQARAARLQTAVAAHFTVAHMTSEILTFYGDHAR